MELSKKGIALMILAALLLIGNCVAFGFGISYSREHKTIGGVSFWYELVLFLLSFTLDGTWLVGFEYALRRNPNEFPRRYRFRRVVLCVLVCLLTILDLAIFQCPTVVNLTLHPTTINDNISQTNQTTITPNHATKNSVPDWRILSTLVITIVILLIDAKLCYDDAIWLYNTRNYIQLPPCPPQRLDETPIRAHARHPSGNTWTIGSNGITANDGFEEIPLHEITE